MAQKRDLQMTIHRLIATKVTDRPITTGAVGSFSVMDAEPNSIRTHRVATLLNEPEAHVGRIYSAFAIIALLLVSPAFGQYVAVIQACSRDVLEFCASDGAKGSRLTECTKAHFQEFTEPCKAALVKIRAVREACGADIQKQCPGVRPGAGRILMCVKRHFAALSEPCKDSIGHAAERKVRAH